MAWRPEVIFDPILSGPQLDEIKTTNKTKTNNFLVISESTDSQRDDQNTTSSGAEPEG